MPADTSHARTPKQARSRESFERVIEATLELLRERTYDQITLSDISRQAGVSTGAMYGRIDGKDSLLRVVQQRFYAALGEEADVLRERIDRLPPSLTEVVPAVVEGLAALLERHAPVLRAFMLQANHDPVIGAAGAAFGKQDLGRFSAVLMRCRSEVRHPEPDRAIASSMQVLYAVLARYLRLDTIGGVESDGWATLNDDLTDMMLAFLLFPGRPRGDSAPARARPAVLVPGSSAQPKKRAR